MEASPVPIQHLNICQEVMGQQDRLRSLQVGVTWHDDIQTCTRLRHYHPSKLLDLHR
jgi:hypothetical protein